VAVGAGALGSHVILNITRTGHRHWTIIDDDVLLPHNCARHALTSWVIGCNKSEAMVPIISDVIDEDMSVTPLAANVLTPSEEDCKKLETAFSGSALVCDFSASVAVGKAYRTTM
jgi:tRNA A37 threonylcarbamoyladenosine dehydratase